MAELIAGYNVITKLGEGARSQVYKVLEPASGKLYAIKRVVREKNEDTRFLDQAINEHEISRKFDHPYLRKSFELRRIRTMLKFSEVQEVMEFVDGVSLDVKRPEAMHEIVDIYAKLAQGLDAMHESGYLHTDLKPNNILLTRDGHLKIIDFGQSCPNGFRKPRIQGTPDYIAPEQVERQVLTPQTDVFNLGATIYWLLTGQNYPTMITKQGSNNEVIASAPVNVPTPQKVNPKVPSALSRLVMESCDYDRNRRPRNMKQVLSRLELVQHVLRREQDISESPAESPAALSGASAAKPLAPAAPTASQDSPAAPEAPPAPADSWDDYDYSAFADVVERARRKGRKPAEGTP